MKIRKLAVMTGIALAVNGCEENYVVQPVIQRALDEPGLWKEFQETCTRQTYQSLRDPDNYSLRNIVEKRGPSQVEWKCKLENGKYVAVQEIREDETEWLIPILPILQ